MLAAGVVLASLLRERQVLVRRAARTGAERAALLKAVAYTVRHEVNALVGSLPVEKGEAGRDEQVRKLNAALADALEVCDAAAGGLSVSPKMVDLRSEVRRLIGLVNDRLEREGRPVIVRPSGLVQFWAIADPLRLRQCLGTLIDQAVAQTPWGRVLVSMRTEELGCGGHRVTFLVKDSGPGMDQARARFFFDPVRYGENPALAGRPAAMLALNLARDLAIAMGGTISAHSRAGCGTTFLMKFTTEPCSPPDGETTDDPGQGLRADLVEPDLAALSVLLVDDDPLQRFVLEEAVVPCGFGRVVSLGSGDEARAQARSERFDVVLTDLVMPGTDGFELARAVRSAGESREAAIIAVSAASLGAGTSQWRRAGINGVVEKPIQRRELLRAIHAAIREQRSEQRGLAQATDPNQPAGVPA